MKMNSTLKAAYDKYTAAQDEFDDAVTASITRMLSAQKAEVLAALAERDEEPRRSLLNKIERAEALASNSRAVQTTTVLNGDLRRALTEAGL